MLPLFAIYLVWLLWLVAWLAVTAVPLRGVRKLHPPEEIVYRLVTVTAAGLLFTLTPWPGLDVQYRLWHRAIDNGLAWRMVFAVGAALCFAGWALLCRHVAFRRGAGIVTSGPYALVRHPVYLGLIIAVFATAIFFGRLSSFAGAILFTIAFVTKAVIEEQRSKGPALAAYKRRALMFVPMLGFARFFLTGPVQRLKQSLLRGELVRPVPIPVAPALAKAPPAAVRADTERVVEAVAPLSRVRSVRLDLVLRDEDGAGA